MSIHPSIQAQAQARFLLPSRPLELSSKEPRYLVQVPPCQLLVDKRQPTSSGHKVFNGLSILIADAVEQLGLEYGITRI